MKKILLILFGLLFVSGAYSAQIANVEYVHKMIEQTWDITVPYNSALNSVKQIANMKYLLTAVDVANHMLNGSATTDYGNGEFATLQATDTDTVNTAVETLIVGDGTTERNYNFFITTTSSTTSFDFSISAAGEFYVDWGDGTRNKITRTNTQNLKYSHNYSTAGTYTIKIGGKATAYNTSIYTAAISFYVNSSQTKIASIDGSLGAIFGTLSSDTNNQPKFYRTFYNATNMTGSIPSDLFAGISGAPAIQMFYGTFDGCTGLTGAIPDGLFGNLTGAPASDMFRYTFSDCSGLTGAIPDGLFGNLTGAPAYAMFNGTFSGCSGLTSIPSDLFAGISGAPAYGMFWGTFSGCSGLTGAIPDGLFGNLSGATTEGMANHMFAYTFSGCSGLTGAIPDGLFGNLSGAPAEDMFFGTFSGCSGLTSIPENLFGNISGTAQDGMFNETFYNCTSLTGQSARINGQYLYEIWPSATSSQVGDMYTGATKLDDYRCIPTAWGGGGENCSAPTPEFTLTTTPDTSDFGFSISAAGEFVVDWGDGTVETITKPDTTNTTYSHNYATAGAYTIGLSGQATAYNTDEYTPAIGFVDILNGEFESTWQIASIDGSLGAIFGTLSSGTNKQPRFLGTFSYATNMTGSIPSDLFAGISGAPASNMFAYTFDSCSGLTSIPDGLFAGISGAPASYMFDSTFVDCSGLTGAIPDGLFGNLTGAPASNMFSHTFSGCSGLTGAIPDGLFGNLTGAPASYMFNNTFSNCSGLTGAIPDGLFGNLTGAPALGMFNGTFSGCSGLTSIPSDLFAGISGAPASSMFSYTFDGCSGLTGAIPDGLFGNLSGAPAYGMFSGTFRSCRGLTGAIPDGLFGNLTGAPAEHMFYETFRGCSGLTSIPENLFGNISGTAQYYMFPRTFYNCTSLTGPSARINGQYLYEIWPIVTSDQVANMYSGATKLDDYRCIPTVWGGGGENCSAPTPEFTLTTTPDTSDFGFSISAAGEFVVDWGDGTVETITKPDTTYTTYSHNYATANTYTIGLSGQATAYNTDEETAAISFDDAGFSESIASIDGSLGAIFGTLSSDTNNQPRFYNTFYNATNMTGSIPSDLFAGISGAPASYMFYYTFAYCSGLTSIPENLFAGISGAPASNMFAYTFEGCSGLTSIPDGLFAGITGAPAFGMFDSTFEGCSGLTSIPDGLFAGITGAPASSMFFYTFSGCSGLTSIPDGLFAGISGAPASEMFHSTFYNCSGLTSIPENLFGNISGTAQNGMFYSTFDNCTSLTGPSARINGQYLYEIWPSATSSQVKDMYTGATKLDDYRCIPTAWGGGGENCSAPTPEFTLTTTPDTSSFSFKISAAGEFVVDWGDGTVETITKPDTTNTTYSHNYTTAGAYTIGLSGQATAYNTDENTAAISFSSSASKIASIDGSLGAIFGTLSSDTNNQPRFYQTFYKAPYMTGSIPSDLFAGISGAPASSMFSGTFGGCIGLTGAIPDGLFGNLTGAPADHMFYGTFSLCSGLTGAIPDGLFGNLTGAPASSMFSNTFYGCSGLTGAIPDGLFAGISGAPAVSMFNSTFRGCNGLTSIPENLFGNISGTAQSNMFYRTFYNCTSLTGPSARINGQYLYEIWPSATSDQVDGMYYNATKLDDYRCIPTAWGGGGEDCSAPTPEFTLTTTPDTSDFGFSISAAGEFVVDWGDGTVETITKPDTTNTIYTHNYTTAGAYRIGLSGQATAYNTDEDTPAISFEASSYQIASIDGSLGAIFGTLSSDTNNQPRFYWTFYNASNMTGSIPSDLFAGISGAPASFMFSSTFYGCSGLTGAIPDGLFAGISGAPAPGMFGSTFYGCSGLTSIPENLFGNISGTAQSNMFYGTFYDCTSLTGPSARINGQYLYEIWKASLWATYKRCTGLSDYSSIPYDWLDN